MGPSRTVSEINGDFRRKSQIFLTPMRSASTQGFPLELGNVGWLQEIRMTGAIWPRKRFDDICSHLDAIHECDERTDGRRVTGRRLVPRLCIASRGKNKHPSPNPRV